MRILTLPRAERPTVVEFTPTSDINVGYVVGGEGVQLYINFNDPEKAFTYTSFREGSHFGCPLKSFVHWPEQESKVHFITVHDKITYTAHYEYNTGAYFYRSEPNDFIILKAKPTPFGYCVTEQCMRRTRPSNTRGCHVYYGLVNWADYTHKFPGTINLVSLVENYYYMPNVYFGNTPDIFCVTGVRKKDYYLRTIDGHNVGKPVVIKVNGRILDVWPGKDVSYVAYTESKRRKTTNSLAFVNSNTGEVMSSMELPTPFKRVSVSPDGLLLMGWGERQMVIIDIG